MPAETIHGSFGPSDVRIAWGADSGQIQVASLMQNGMDVVIHMVNEWLNEAGSSPIDPAGLRTALNAKGILPTFDGWHVTLEHRSEVNRMIAVLRRARDHAFGKDE